MVSRQVGRLRWDTSTMTPSWMSRLSNAPPRVCIAFWLFGLINNIFYSIILAAALDLVGPRIPKAVILLTCIVPSLATKIVAPYFIHLVPYSTRTVIFVGLATTGMLAVALSDQSSVVAKLIGIVLANISAGAGEVSFVALTHFYGPFSLAAWGSGTGAAGLVGAGAYTIATSSGMSTRATLLCSVVLSLVMLFTYFCVLPLGELETQYSRIGAEERHDDALDKPGDTLGSRLKRAKTLIIPYMLPLFLVYFAEYTINQGVAPTLLFPLEHSPFKAFREFYPAYGTMYQLGVFISRSSLPFVRIRTLYVPTWLQVLNLALLTAQALRPTISVYAVMTIILWEGLLGGLVYVSTFAAVREDLPRDQREFSLGAVTVSDAAGIAMAGVVGSVMEVQLCAWQVRHGRDWCTRT